MKYERLYISSDIEGVAGVVTADQATKAGFEFEKAREWMTNEVVAACEAAFDQGIKEIIVSDSHGGGQNLLLDKLPKGVQLVRSWPRPLSMMQGIEEGNFDAALLLGYHTGATAQHGIMAHTMSGVFSDVRVNGESASETDINTAIAAHFGVPVIMVSGDDAYTEHARNVLGDVETATVKWAYSSYSARTILPTEACALIAEKTTAALARLNDFTPPKKSTDIKMEVQFIKPKLAEIFDYLPNFERSSARGIQFTGKDIIEVSRVLRCLSTCGKAIL